MEVCGGVQGNGGARRVVAAGGTGGYITRGKAWSTEGGEDFMEG
jgi:hypothetical protein